MKAFTLMRMSSFKINTTTININTTSSTLLLLQSLSLLFTSCVRIGKQQSNNNNLGMKVKDGGCCGGGLEGDYFDGLLY